MESRAQSLEALLARSTGQEALGYAIQAAELYMAAADKASTAATATRLRRKCHDLIVHAERLKAQEATEALSGYPDILRQASRLHGNDFPPWNAISADEFDLDFGAHPYTDNSPFTLSATQTENFSGWSRPAEVFRLSPQRDQRQDEEVLMQTAGRCDLVQDITTDCSVVASLSAAAKVLIGQPAVLSSIIHPFDHIKGRPKLSPSGKYVLRMNFNGCLRRVVVDDRLPASRTDRALFVVDRCNPYLLWPALLEKAYLKVRGGYDFPGSNSGTDLWVLTGWIPEQLFLQREDFDVDETWTRIKNAHESHNVVVTLGTGRISTEEEQLMGLIGEHDYAVEGLDSLVNGARSLLIKNPWCDAPLMVGTGRPGAQNSVSNNTTWMALEDVAQHFESMYLNWNPSVFSHRQDHHFTWEMPPRFLAASLVRNPQYTISCASGGSIWILVSRHFVDAELEIARNRRGSMAAVARQLGFMSILVFENEGKRVQVSGAETYRGPYVDSPQTLARLEVQRGKQYLIAVDQQELPLPSYVFTMTLFSHSPLRVKEAVESMSHFEERLGSWNRRTAGGNASSATFFQNPQYTLTMNQASPLSILLSTDNLDVHVHVDLIWARGERVTTVRAKDLIASSGEYRRGCAVATVDNLKRGVYTLVCSTFEAGQLAAFAIRVSSTTPVAVDIIGTDAAGRLRTPLPTFSHARGEEKRRAPLNVSWLTRASVSVHSVVLPGAENGARQASSCILLRVSVIRNLGPEHVIVATSGEGQFREPAALLRTTEFDMEPSRAHDGMWLVVECIGSHQAEWTMEGEVLSDSPVHIGPWERF
ncbi:hypothetical protein CDD83_2032 [Cordyceps sp. RAO-2017]|nr:hypothetical protein CDD83_2032 [Cordyceps sp. RAO-2017]